MTESTIPCDKTTKQDISEIQDELDEAEPYYVTQDLVLQELVESYRVLSAIFENTSQDKVKALAEGKASIEYDNQTGQGKGKGKGAEEDEGEQNKQ